MEWDPGHHLFLLLPPHIAQQVGIQRGTRASVTLLSKRRLSREKPPQELLLGGSSELGYVVNNHGDRSCPLSRVVGPLPNGLFMAYKWG